MLDTSATDLGQDEWTVPGSPPRRWKVFPVSGKRPALGGDWRGRATNETAKISQWLEAGYGLALACDLSGVVVLDPDADKATREPLGERELAELGELPATYTRSTPGGGKHLYFDDGGEPVAGRDLAPHVNMRSRGGYVVLYDPAVVDALANGRQPAVDLAPLPTWVRDRAGVRAATKAAASHETQLTDEHKARARSWLERRKPAIEGASGDNWTYQTICGALDLLPTDDADVVAEVMADWNSGCWPPWDDDELEIKIENALAYRQNDVGAWATPAPRERFNAYMKGTAPSLLDPWAEFIAPAFPLDTLPPRLRAFVERKTLSIGGDPGAIAMSALAVCSGALDHGFRVRMQVHDSWYENPRLWVLLVGDPSTKKTPIINTALHPLEEAAAANAKRQAEEDRGHAEAKAAAQGKIILPERTWFDRYIAQDITVESVGELLSRQSRGLLVKYDELAGWIGSMDKYGGSKAGMSDRAFWLKTYDGGAYHIDRKTTGSRFVQNCSVAFLGGIQPDRLADLGNVTSDGLLQRFLPVLMRPAERSQDVPGGSAVADYEDLIGRLLRLGPREIPLSPEARDVKGRLESFLHEVVQRGPNGSPRAFAGKLTGLWGRLALVLHLAGDPDDGSMGAISGAVAESADRLIRSYLLPHAVAFYDRATDGDQQANLRDLASYVLTTGKDRFVASDFTANIRFMRGMKGWDVFATVDALVAGGWLEPDGDHVPHKAWKVLPGVREALAERRSTEADRKASIVKIMRALGQSA